MHETAETRSLLHLEWDSIIKFNLNDLPTNTRYAKDHNQNPEDNQAKYILQWFDKWREHPCESAAKPKNSWKNNKLYFYKGFFLQ